ncbi:MAG: NAD(P)-binding protein [Gammaproteobacteria bacterium]|nr:NAD(P)-binding protein [Gammaproteobacteria bacterium]
MATDIDQDYEKLTFRVYEDGETKWEDWQEAIFSADHSHKCPTYVHRTPPCQGSCPSGEDVRGWLQIVKGIEKPPAGMDWEEYAFQRSTNANPFPSMMGRVCPAPCEDGCNRNDVEDYVGINSIEQFIGDNAFEKKYNFSPSVAEIGKKKVAIIGGGPAGLAAAYQLRRKGHGSVIFDDHAELGGMMRYGIPGYRTPRMHLDHEITRILDMGGIEVRTGIKVGRDVSVSDLDNEFDAVLWTIGCQTGRGLPVPGADAPNCVSGVKFLEAFNQGTLKVTADRVVCVGGGDTSIDVVSVARRLGKIKNMNKSHRPEAVIGGYVAHDSAYAALREGAEVTLTSLFPKSQMTATEEEVEDALHEGVDIKYGTMPIEVLKDENGRATALRMAECRFEEDGRPVPVEGTEFDIECDLIVSAIGQGGNLEGLEEFDNGRGLMDADKFYQYPGREGHFVAGDIIRPHLLTTAIGQASIAADSIDHFFRNSEPVKRPKVDVHHFDLLNKLRESALEPEGYDHQQEWGTCDANFAIHNYEDRSAHEVIPSDKLFLGHFSFTPRNKRGNKGPGKDEVLSHFEERHIGLTAEAARKEADRCMSCGMCFECDNCVIYCPQDAVFRVKKDQSTLGRYVDTDYSKCIGCHICADVCPTGYIEMGMGE